MAPEADDTTTMLDITESTALTQPTTQPSTASTTNLSTSKKRRKRHQKPHILLQQTLRSPAWVYIHLRHLSNSPPPLDAVTAHLHLTTALQQFLGLHGSAITFDVLKLDAQDVWIRAQAEDQRAIVAAAGGWVSGKGEGWRVVGWSWWDAGVGGAGGGGQDLFGD